MSKKISELPESVDIYDGCCIPIVTDGETKKLYYSLLKDKVKGDILTEGGTTGQVLAKASDDDYDTEWVDPTGGEVNVANNLTTTEEGFVLDARQGKALNDNKVNITDIANNLTTTEEGFVLDARQGKALKEQIENSVSSNYKLLWTNPNPSNAFVAQSISLSENIQNYRFVLIECAVDTYKPQLLVSQTLPIGFQARMISVGAYYFHRDITVPSTGKSVSIGNGTDQNSQVNNQALIPQFIYGIK